MQAKTVFDFQRVWATRFAGKTKKVIAFESEPDQNLQFNYRRRVRSHGTTPQLGFDPRLTARKAGYVHERA